MLRNRKGTRTVVPFDSCFQGNSALRWHRLKFYREIKTGKTICVSLASVAKQHRSCLRLGQCRKENRQILNQPCPLASHSSPGELPEHGILTDSVLWTETTVVKYKMQSGTIPMYYRISGLSLGKLPLARTTHSLLHLPQCWSLNGCSKSNYYVSRNSLIEGQADHLQKETPETTALLNLHILHQCSSAHSLP